MFQYGQMWSHMSSALLIMLLFNTDANLIKNLSGEKSVEDLSIMFLDALL